MTEYFNFHGDYITLGQMIKVLNILESGGQIKFFLQDYSVKVNGSLEQRRGRKLRDGDLIEIEDIGTWKMKAE